jgi:DNA invertase Pin-like site-specific DNA recombinase
VDGKFIAYYRVSTDRQGMNGNGMTAQRKAVEDYLNSGRWKAPCRRRLPQYTPRYAEHFDRAQAGML